MWVISQFGGFQRIGVATAWYNSRAAALSASPLCLVPGVLAKCFCPEGLGFRV